MTATDQNEILQRLCCEVGKALEFEISFQVTSKYLEIADVEGGSFYGTGKQQERSKTYRDAMLCSISVDNKRNQNKLTFKLQFLGIKAKFHIGSIKEANSPPKQFVTSQQL